MADDAQHSANEYARTPSRLRRNVGVKIAVVPPALVATGLSAGEKSGRRLHWTAAVMATAVAAVLVGMSTTSTAATTVRAAATTNKCGNPVLASNLKGWGGLDGAQGKRVSATGLARVKWAFGITGTHFYMPQLSVKPGQLWTFSALDRIVNGSGSAKIGVDWYDSHGRFISERTGAAVALPATTKSSGTWTYVSAAFRVPATAKTAHVIQYGEGGSAAGTQFRATRCDYELSTGNASAAVRGAWGATNSSQSDEYNASFVDLSKWVLFGAGPGETTGCSKGFNLQGTRCASQTTERKGFLSVNGTSKGKTGGLWSVHSAFRYGRVEVRERTVPLHKAGTPYSAVALLWGSKATPGEIDFGEYGVGSRGVAFWVHGSNGANLAHCSWKGNSTAFHNYAIDWQPTKISWYVDGVRRCVVPEKISSFQKTNGGAQLDLLNLPPKGGKMQPARQDVDWIRMYPIAETQYR